MPERLFYFSPLNTSERRSWLERILVKSEVYFRNRDQLNVPNELRPTMVAEGTDKERRTFARNQIARRWPIRLSPAKRLLEETKLIHMYKTPGWLERIMHDILGGIGLLSMSATAEEGLLWAYYAEGHRGVCIEFEGGVGLFAAAQEVTYTDQAPVINLLEDGRTTQIRKSMLTKASRWAHEREWRVLARWRDEERTQRFLMQHAVPPHIQAFMRAQDGPGYYSFPPEAVRSVILGARADTETAEWLQGISGRLPQSVAIRRAQIDRAGTVTIQ
jgi:hypothetical protein